MSIWCECAQTEISRKNCGCKRSDDLWDDSYDTYIDPPLYPVGKLAGMTVEQLECEYGRQSTRQGRLGDCENIDERAVEQTEARCRLVENELKKRKGV